MRIENKTQIEKDLEGKLSNEVAKVKALALLTSFAVTYGIGCATIGVEETNNFFKLAFYEIPKQIITHYNPL